MLRWCRWTFRTLDGRTTSLRRFSSTVFYAYQHAPTSQYAALSLRLSPGPSYDTQQTLPHTMAATPTRSLTKLSEPGLRSSSPILESSIGKLNAPSLPYPLPEPLELSEVLNVLFEPAYDDTSTPLTPATLYSRYQQVKRDHTPLHFSDEHFTDLITFFGLVASEQIPDNDAHCSVNWRRVLEIGKDKGNTGYPLGVQVRYWLLRACIAESARLGISWDQQPILIEDAVRHCEALLSDGNPPLNFMALSAFFLSSTSFANALPGVVTRWPSLGNSLSRLFWNLVLQHGPRLDSESRTKLCALALRNANRHEDHTLPPSPPSPQPLSIRDLARITAVYISFSAREPLAGQALQPWVRQLATSALDQNIDPDIRWRNLLQAGGFVPFEDTSLAVTPPTACQAEWNLVFGLTSILDLDSRIEAAPVVLSLWEGWNVTSTPRPLSSFSAQVITAEVSRCFARFSNVDPPPSLTQFYTATDLWKLSRHPSPLDRVQVVDSIFAFMQVSLQGCPFPWTELFDFVTRRTSDLCWREAVVDTLLKHYSTTKPDLAYSLVRYALRNSISIPTSSLLLLAECLALQRRWAHLRLLLAPPYNRQQTKYLIGRCLRVIQTHRLEKVNDVVAQWLLHRLAMLYSHRRIPLSMKYPLRYFLEVAIRSGFPFEAVALIRVGQKSLPTLFTPAPARRVIMDLLRLKKRDLALELFAFFSTVLPPAAVEGIRRNISHCLAPKEKTTSPAQSKHPFHRSTHPISCQRHTPLSPTNQIITANIVRSITASSSISVIRRAVSLLVRNKRVYLARKVLAKVQGHLCDRDRTTLGNIILHGSVMRHGMRGRHRMRHILSTKVFLEKNCQFVMDRTTINILLKAMLRWPEAFHADRVRFLFDQLVHEGYPVSDRFRSGRPNGVPFGHARDPSAWDREGSTSSVFSTLSPQVTFTRHMRPLLKMFIKAFYLRDDVAAAKTLVGILKDAEVMDRAEREKRSRARREGIKKRRNLSQEPERHADDLRQ